MKPPRERGSVLECAGPPALFVAAGSVRRSRSTHRLTPPVRPAIVLFPPAHPPGFRAMTTPPDQPPSTPKGIDAADLDPSRRPPHRRLWPWIVGGLFLIPVLVVLAFNWHAARQLRQALDDLAARGEPVTFTQAYDLLAADPPAGDDNLAEIPLLLMLHDSEPGRAMRLQLERDEPERLELWDRFDTAGGRGTGVCASSAERTREDFDHWHPDHPDSANTEPDDWPWIDHDDGPAASLYEMSAFLHPLIHELAAECRHRSRALWSRPEIGDDALLWVRVDQLGADPNSLINRSQTLRTIALAALERGDPELAVAAIELQLAFGRAVGHAHGLIGLLTTTVTLMQADGPIYEGLQRRVWDEDQLARLQHALDLSLPALDPTPALRMERIIALDTVQLLKRERNGGDEYGIFASSSQNLTFRLLPGGAFDRAAVQVIEGFNPTPVQPDAPLPAQDDPLERRLPAWLEWLDTVDIVSLVTPVFSGTLMRSRCREARLRLAHAAIAIDRHHLRHGHYPDDWEELVPALLDEPSFDPFTGGELMLLPAESGGHRPVIYSAGPNGEDNGGTQASNPGARFAADDTQPNGDIVWACPTDEP